MRQLNYGKLFKATLATTVAAGAIVAVAPVNTEAAPRGFSDVKNIPSHHFYEAVMDLSSKGIIGGYPDGTFKPNQNISRQHAAKFLSLALGLDTRNVKNPGFKDVNKTNPYYGSIAALVEAGIISGNKDNTFKPNDNLTRTQMAKMLVLGFDLKSKGPQKNPFSDVDNNNWNKSFVQVLYANEITTGTTSSTYSPNASVTRGQLASFIFRSETATKVSKPMPEPEHVPEVVDRNQPAVDAAYHQVKGGSLTIPNGNNATDEQKLAAVQTYASSLITEQGVVAKVAEVKRAGLYVVTLSKGGAKVNKTITMKFESPVSTHVITEVKALNAKQVEVKFATPVSQLTVVDAWNVVQNISITANTNATANPGQLTGSLSLDGRTLTITANNIFNGDYTFTSTDAIKSTTGEAFEKFSATMIANDTAAPAISSVEWKDGKIVVSFTKNITRGTNNTITVVNQNTGVSTPIYLNNYSGTNTVTANNTLTIQHALQNGSYQLRIPSNTVVDTLGISNPIELTTKTFTVQTAGWDTTPPVVYGITNSSVSGTQAVTYTVTDENSGVDLESVRNINNYTWDGYALPTGSSATASVTTGTTDKATSVAVTVYVPTTSIGTTKTATFTVNNIRDNAGNRITYAGSANITLGSGYYNQPEFTSATIGSNNNNSLILSFNTPMQSVDANDFAITLNGHRVQSSSISPNYDNTTFTADIRVAIANDVPINGVISDVVYLETNGSNGYDPGDLVLGLVDASTYWASSYSEPINFSHSYVTSLTVELINDYSSPAKDYYGNYARFGQVFKVR